MTASLPSNNGEAKITLGFNGRSEYAHEPGFESTIRIEGRLWDGNHTHPIAFSVEGVWLSLDGLQKFRDHIIGWNSLPPNQMGQSLLNGDFELATLPGQKVCLSFGPRPDVISGMNPVVSILVNAGPFLGQYHFVTDQSCLGHFAHELSSAMNTRA